MQQNGTTRWWQSFTRPLGKLGRPIARSGASARRTSDTGFQNSFDAFRDLANQSGGRLSVRWEDRHPCLEDATQTTGFDRHYICHVAWAARVLAETRPVEHVDIGSSLYFAATASGFIPLRFYDYRPAPLRLGNFSSGHADLTCLDWPERSIASLSCMHVAELVGLGRYGDRLDADGDRKSDALASESRGARWLAAVCGARGPATRLLQRTSHLCVRARTGWVSGPGTSTVRVNT
jgi:hypothetical protein